MIPNGVAAASAALLVMQLACGRDAQDRRADAVVSDAKGKSFPVANPVLSTEPARDSVSLFPVTWTVDFLLGRLASAGLSPTLAGPVLQKHMAVPGTRVLIPGAELEVYLYGDANATAQDIDRFYRLTRNPRDSGLVWEKPPALITANNMVIVVVTADAALRERVRGVLHLSRTHAPPSAAP